MTPRPKLIVFDLDGTLVPTMRGFADIAGRVIEKTYGWTFAKAREAYLETSGIAFFKQLEVLFPKDDRNGVAAEQFETEKKVHFFSQEISDDVKQTLADLRETGMFLAVSSNNFEFLVQRFISRTAPGIFHYLCGFKDGFEKGKDHFDFLEEGLSVSRADMLFVADSLSDLKTARSEGVAFVALEGTFPKEAFTKLDAGTRVIQSITQIPKLLQSPLPGEAGGIHERHHSSSRLRDAT